MKCDFCSVPEVTWRYPAKDFCGYAFENIIGESVGDWAACDECHRLIESGNRVGLTDRSMGMLVAAQPEMAEFLEELTAEMRRLHERFFEHRQGPATRVRAALQSPVAAAGNTQQAADRGGCLG